MRKETKYTFERMNKDISKTKSSPTLYWDALNMRVVTNKEFGNLTNDKGNIKAFTLPSIETNPTNKTLTGLTFPITNPTIIHTEKIDEQVIIFAQEDIFTLIFLLDVDTMTEPELIYVDDLGIDPETSIIESVGINESDQSQKIYWVDGVNEVRFLNIIQNNLDKTSDQISVNPPVTLLDPNFIEYQAGGSHKTGTIQYAYNLYNKFGAETKVSGLSELISLFNDEGDNSLDARVNVSPNIQIPNIPQDFEYLKVYSIYYSSLGQVPRISLIYENENTSEELNLTDTNDIIREISLNEFNILSNQVIIPKHISNKDGHLFFGDYKTEKFDFDYDARAFTFEKDGVDYVNDYDHSNDKYGTLSVFTNDQTVYDTFLDNIPTDHDLIPRVKELGFQFGTNTLGYAGKNVSVEVKYKNNSINELDTTSSSTSLKRGETYRVGLVGYNDKDEESFVKWIADIKIPTSESILVGENAQLAYLEVKVDNLPDEVISYRLVKVKRLQKDKTIKAQGFISNNILNYEGDTQDSLVGKVKEFSSNYFTRTIGASELTEPTSYEVTNTVSTLRGDKFNPIATLNSDILDREIETSLIDSVVDYFKLSERDFSITSAEIKERDININKVSDKIRVIGLASASDTYNKVDFYTSYSFNRAFGEEDKNSDLYDVSIEEPIKARVTFEDINTDDLLYTFQVDEPNSAAIGGYDPWGLKELFFNLENNATDNTSFRLINPRRSQFTFTKEDSTTIEINDWEYKKILVNRKFENFNNITAANEATFLTDGYILKTNDFEEVILINNFSFEEDTNDAPQIIDKIVTYNNFFERNNLKSNFYTTSNSKLIFNSDDLFSVINALESEVTKSSLVIAEIYSDDVVQYGGNTYNDRQRNQYIPLSKKQTNTLLSKPNITSIYGDTYIQKQSYLSNNYTTSPSAELEGTLAEVITYVGESSINHDMRYDKIGDKNNTFNTSFDDAFKYNEVYQQENDLIKSLTKPFNFVTQERFKSEVVASPKKLLGEFIDNWTKISINDRLTLDTKYGAITGFGKLKDNLFAFQRNAIAYLSINPRVQLSASDNIPIELGTGKLIERSEYISTTSGTLHPRSIVPTQSVLYYYDILNASINKLTGTTEEISLTKGLYNYVKDYTDENYTELLNGNGITGFYNNEKEEVYFTFKATDSFTVAYNLLSDGFTSFYSFLPDQYILLNNKMYTYINEGETADLWEHDNPNAEYSNYYGTKYVSTITILANEYPDNDKVFDNVSYVMDTDLDDADQTLATYDVIQVTNPYQDTGKVKLSLDTNIKRKFRVFRIQLPREQGTRNRIRSPYALIKLTFSNLDTNYKFVCYDMTVSYTIS